MSKLKRSIASVTNHLKFEDSVSGLKAECSVSGDRKNLDAGVLFLSEEKPPQYEGGPKQRVQIGSFRFDGSNVNITLSKEHFGKFDQASLFALDIIKSEVNFASEEEVVKS